MSKRNEPAYSRTCKIEAKWTLLILHLRKIEAKQILFSPQIRKFDAEQTLFIPQIGKSEAKQSEVCLFHKFEKSKRRKFCLFHQLERSKRSEVCLFHKFDRLKGGELDLKGVWHEIFDFMFFSWISVLQAPRYSIGAILNFFKNSQRYLRIILYHRCQRHR